MKPGNKILFVLCAIGIAAGVYIYLEAKSFQKTASVTVGTVANSGLSRYEIRYTSDDGIVRTYKGNQSSKGRTHHNGDEIKVFYKTADPDRVRISDGVKFGKKMVFYISLLLLFNVYSVYQGRKRDKSENIFRTTGRKAEAQILRIDMDKTVAIKGQNPYFLHCSWVDPITGREYTHTLRNIWKDPKILLAGRSGIDVYIDRNDPEKYFMDISFLGEGVR